MHMSKPMDYTTPSVNTNVSYGIWVIMCQCKFISGKKCTTFMGDVVIGEAILIYWQGVGGNFCRFFLVLL